MESFQMRKLEKEELASCVKNSLSCHEDEESFLTFLRFTDRQLQVYEPDPLFRLMSRCSSGVCLDLETNGDELVFECKTAELKPKLLVQIKGEMTIGQVVTLLGSTLLKASKAGNKIDLSQHFDVYVNGCYQSAVRLVNGQICIPLCNPGHEWIRVKVWFPLLIPLAIRNVSLNGEWRRTGEKRPVLYAFGDSITQGFITGRPSFCYVAQLSGLLGVDALNQGIGGAMFDPHILDDLENLTAPDLVTVAYGTNDWQHGFDFATIQERARQFFSRLSQLYPRVPAYVLTPIWREDMDQEPKCGPFAGVIQMIRDVACGYPAVRIIDGMAVSPHIPACYSDGFLHPNALGFSYLAQRLYKTIREYQAARG